MVKDNGTLRKEIENIIFNIWNPLTEEEQNEISNNLTIETFDKNQYIYRENEVPTSIKCLISGKAKICKNGINGRDQILRTIRPKEMFAFRAYFAHDDYLTSAMSLERSVIASIPMELVADSLLTLKERYGLEEDGYTISIFLSREELANMSNMTTSNAIRTLSAFANEKIIAIDGRKIKIINEAELKHISDNE